MAQRNTDNIKTIEYHHYILHFSFKKHVSVSAVCLHHVGEHVSSKWQFAQKHSGKVQDLKEERHHTNTTETNNTVDNVTVRQLYFHMLPRLSYIICWQPEQSAQERNSHRFHNHPGNQDDSDSHSEAQQAESHHADAERWES